MNLASFGGPALALRAHVTKRVDAMTPRQRKVSRLLSMFGLVALTSLLSAERSEEHTSELQSLMRISYAVFCLKKKKISSRIQIVHLNTASLTVRIANKQYH